MITVPVDLRERSYNVFVGAGVRDRLSASLPHGVKRVVIVTQEGIDVEVDVKVPTTTEILPSGEQAKSLQTIEILCRSFAAAGLTRADAVIGLGGGVVTDVAGFAAAVYHRGVAVIHVPTTLLGMVDAAIGGKTGVNLPEGKNLVGAFWQPRAVFCDTETLAGLPQRELRSGLGELAKYRFLTGGSLDDLTLDQRIAAAVRIKAAAVVADEHERTGQRATLNYGHTLGHALETAGRYDLRHGEAVSIGLVFAARLAARLGRIDAERVAEHIRVVASDDLPVQLPADVEHDELINLMRRDKKATGDGLTFVLDGPHGVELVTDVSETDVRAALEEMGKS